MTIWGSNNRSLYARVPSLCLGLYLDMPTSVSKSITEHMRVLSFYRGLSIYFSINISNGAYIYIFIYFVTRPSMYAHFTKSKAPLYVWAH